ncbi:glutamate-cysteine ligase family protein [Aliifodinibius sp. S!AR15-10]|uniref:carboxylate-amine ligase n=1 Tax=Aliifodinibius sp. S!AR15-10 TaxID=2950437 RepID=UPI0028672D48|nr:glutamate-cysteine ligase family protein [Aliifodinibius sp. S!AR15-10]MDR8391661.1 glutamate-cysteine ligase family protein [Aliifodinibius sp. S!AR15-10]
MSKDKLHLFEAVGVELEYMIVDRETLAVRPIADQLLHQVAGEYTNQIERGVISWSNELVLHVIELKTNGPARSLEGLHRAFQEEVNHINQLLEAHNAMLLPTAMHPLMDPYKEMKLWPHEYNPIYEAYNRIFDCRGHGWANLQSTHINLPFSGDEEFGKLHAAIRILLPVLPGIAASSPIADGAPTGFMDYRMEVYRTNSQKVPSVMGYIVPEAVFSQAEYNDVIFQKMYQDIAPYDPEVLLQEEWLNSRGAIARFDRGSIEIRVLDIQESPLVDIALVRFIADSLRALVQEQFCPIEALKDWDEQSLYEILLQVIKHGEKALLPPEYCRSFGINSDSKVQVGDFWTHIFETLYSAEEVKSEEQLTTLEQVLELGSLSCRILTSQQDWNRTTISSVYRTLSNTLSEGTVFNSHG